MKEIKIDGIIKELGIEIKTCHTCTNRDVTGVYSGDLLSDVMANSEEGNLWITLHIHLNIVAVASMKGISGIIIVNGRCPDDYTLKKAEEEKVLIGVSDLSSFEVAGRLYNLLNA